jgi:hypothetical protein
MIELVTAICIALGVTAPPAYVVSDEPVIETPCYEDQVAMVVPYDYEIGEDDLGYWDGDNFYRLCVTIDDMLIVDGRLVANVDQ